MKHFSELNKDLATCRAILKLFHPDLEISDDKLSKMCHKGNYNWMAIEGRVKGYGMVCLSIDDCHDSSMLWGGGHKLKTFIERQPLLQFRIWRIVIDCKFVSYGQEGYGNDELLYDQYHKILTDAGYRTKTAEEWFKLYYSN